MKLIAILGQFQVFWGHAAMEIMSLPAFHAAVKKGLKTAEKYVKSGNYFWNSGMFMFKPSALLAEMKKHSPKIIPACRKAFTSGSRDADFLRLEKENFAASHKNITKSKKAAQNS